MNLFKHTAIIFLLFIALATPALGANATSFLNITATTQSVAAGTNATYVLNLTNNGTDGGDSYYVNITNTDSASTAAINITSPIYVAQAATTMIAFNITNTASGTFRANITATSVNDSTKYGYINTTTTISAVRAVNLSNITATSGASTRGGTNYTYTLIITNNGSDPDTYNIATTNPDSATTVGVNVSSISLSASAIGYIRLNVTNATAGSLYRVNVTATSSNDSTKYGYVNTSLAVYDVPSITTFSPSATVTDTNAVISRTFSVTVNQSATVTYYANGNNVGSAVGTTVTYTNTSAGLGTWNITATAVTSAGEVSQTWVWVIPTSTISSFALNTNGSTNDRVPISINFTYMNFTLSDTGNLTSINLSFPATYNFSGVEAANISTTMGTCTVTLTSTKISCYNATEQNNTGHYVNISAKIKSSAVSATNTITVTTNKNTTGASITQYTRDVTKPFYISMNNSNFVVASESFSTTSETITLTGSGNSNLTFYVANVTGQTNITVGFGASNVTVIRSRYTGAINGMGNMNTIYIETNPTVTNPVIVISAEGEFESSNLPAAITAAGSIAGLTVIYAYLRRRRRH